MLKLYGGARSRASVVKWYLEELGVDYEFILLDMQAGEHRQAPYTNINPIGKVPAIVDGDFTLWESGAILGYLAAKYGGVSDIETRAQLDQWIDFANSTFGSALAMEAVRETAVPRLLDSLETILSDRDFLMGSDFSAADVALGAMLYYGPLMFGLSLEQHPIVAQYAQTLQARSAFQTTFGDR
ncbi:MAG: glutathione S-transferase family protein [Oscillatoriales cyanobacterium]|nr:MAG: glutathione S-transferase family protein [Oscillatoriales cyanobacterium]